MHSTHRRSPSANQDLTGADYNGNLQFPKGEIALPTMQPIKPIRNEADYDLALQEIDHCLDAAAGSPERDKLEVLTVLVDDYEAKHHPIRSDDE